MSRTRKQVVGAIAVAAAPAAAGCRESQTFIDGYNQATKPLLALDTSVGDRGPADIKRMAGQRGHRRLTHSFHKEVAMRGPNQLLTSRAATRSLAKKRRKAIGILLGAAGGTGAVSATPTPGVEFPKQAAIGVADALVFSQIYQAYFDEELDEESLKSMLKQTGVAMAVGGGFAYVSFKLTEVVLAEVLNFVPVVGWAVSGAITASMTLTFGTLWAAACDHAVRTGTAPVLEMQAQMRTAGA